MGTWYYDGNPVVRRYRDPKGRFLSQRKVTDYRNAVVNQASADAVRLARSYHAKELTSGSFNAQMREMIKDSYGAQYVFGKGGLRNMTEGDWAKVGTEVARQHQYLDRFTASLAAGQVIPEGSLVARSKMYANGGVQAYSRGLGERWGIDLPAHPGDGGEGCVCLTNCRCSWRIESVGGRIMAYWENGGADPCEGCQGRAKEYDPWEAPEERVAPDAATDAVSPSRDLSIAELNSHFPNLKTTDFGNYPDETVARVSSRLGEMARDYPEAAGNLTGIVVGGEGMEAGMHASMSGGGVLNLSDQYATLEDWRAEITGQSQDGWLQPWAKDLDATLAHEYGHLVRNTLATRSSNDAYFPVVLGNGEGGLPWLVTEFSKSNRIAQSVSEYGATHEGESWAELFSITRTAPRSEWPVEAVRLDEFLTWVDQHPPGHDGVPEAIADPVTLARYKDQIEAWAIDRRMQLPEGPWSRATASDVKPAAALEWEPTMDEHTARAWAANHGGVYADETFYHFTRESAVDPIMANGLNNSDGGIYGNYVYMTTDDAGVKLGRSGLTERLSTVVQMANPWKGTRSEYDAFLDEHGYAEAQGSPDLEVSIFRDAGYDGIYLTFADGSNNTGGRKPWVLAFDRKSVTVIKHDKTEFE